LSANVAGLGFGLTDAGEHAHFPPAIRALGLQTIAPAKISSATFAGTEGAASQTQVIVPGQT